jgi:WD40 repeat protein
MSATDYKYWGFISYSHQDEAWAQWLHRALEKYAIPKQLVGRELGDGQVPKRLFPVYRDREELSSASDLGAALNRALQLSRNLIVVCSPRSATSRWVNEEIRNFRAMGRGGRIFCLIVDGEPHASEKPDIAFSECFPPALREPSADGSPFEPIAADARERKDGKENAKLKLIAGLIGAGFDELKQREKKRQFWQRVQRSVTALALVALLVGIWQWFVQQRIEREREITIEKLVENGRQELSAGHQARAAVYLNEAYKMGDDSVPVRFMLGQAMPPLEALGNIRVRHGGSEAGYGATFSPDNSRFVIVANNISAGKEIAAAKVFDTATGAQLMTLPDAPAWPLGIQYTRDGIYLLATGYSKTAFNESPVTRVWNLHAPGAHFALEGFNGTLGLSLSATGQTFLLAGKSGLEIRSVVDGKIAAILGAGRSIVAGCYSADGLLIALADAKGLVEIYTAKTRKKLATFREAEGASVSALLFSPDSQRIVSLSAPSDLRIWDIAGKRLVGAFAPDSDWVSSVKFSSNGRRLLTVGSEGYKVWSAIRGSLLLMLQRPLIQLASADLSPDGSLLATADFANSTSEVWDVLSKKQLYSLDFHTNGISSVAFDHSGKQLLLASRDGRAEFWRMPVTPLWKYESYETLPYVARFTHDGQQLLVAGGNQIGSVMLFDRQLSQPFKQFEGHLGVVRAAAFSPKDERLVTASADGTAGLWDVKSGRRIATMDHRPFEAYDAKFSGDGTRIVTLTNWEVANHPDHAGLWDGVSGRLIAWLPHDGLVYAARFNAKGNRIVTASEDGFAKIWNARDGALMATLKGHGARVTDAEFSADGQQVVTAGQDHSVRIWDSATGRLESKLNENAIGLPTQAVFDQRGQSVAIASQNGSVWIWFPASGRTLTLKGHQQAVSGVRFSQRNALLLSFGDDGTVRVWDAQTGLALGIVASHHSAVTSVDMNDEQTSLVSSDWGDVAVWDVGLERRSPQTLATLLKCQAPWALQPSNLTLLQVTPQEAGDGCGARQPF